MARVTQVFVVVPPRALLLDIAGPLEVLRRANREQSRLRFAISYIGPSPTVTTSIGAELANIAPLPDSIPDDALVVLCGNVDSIIESAASSDPKADRRDQAAIVAWLRAAIRPTHKLISICSGALLAARAGLLSNRACTTHYLACAELARLAPGARVLENRLYVEDGNCYSSAGITAGIDLMLHVLRQLTSDACAVAVARYLVVYLRRNGSDPQHSPWLEGRNHIHPGIHRAQDAIAADPAHPWTRAAIARIAHLSPRHLSRLFHEHTGLSLVAYRNSLRIARARDLLQQTALDMDHIAEQVGFDSARQLRRAWNRVNSEPPSRSRERS